MKAKYIGELGTELQHLKSGAIINTDAPTDNNGKGENFSPTDLLCTALCSCMMTLMGIKSAERGIAFEEAHTDIEKLMRSEPRKVEIIRIFMKVKDCEYSDDDKAFIENAARTCPVALSLDPKIKQELTIEYYS